MPDSLSTEFESRCDLLLGAARALAVDLEEALEDASFTVHVDGSVLSVDAFLEEAANQAKAYTHPLIEVTNQILISIEVGDPADMKSVEKDLSNSVSVRSSFWETVAESPVLVLICPIPAVALPAGWENLREPPTSFQIRIVLAPPKASHSESPRKELQLVGEGEEEGVHALILMGGGVKGLAYAGALEYLEKAHQFNWYVGTSAGAIAAVLLGAGFTAQQLRDIFTSKDFTDFLDAGLLERPFNLFLKGGVHHAHTLTDWLDELLAHKLHSPTRVRLSDLPNRVTIYASRRDKSGLTFDSIDNDADAAHAVRCSMSIPWLFIPQSDQGVRTYDGGIQNNFPVKRFLAEHPGTPFVALFLGSLIYKPRRRGLVISDIISISSEGGDLEAVMQFREQTIIIDPSPIPFHQFALTSDEKEFLLNAGRLGAMKHLKIDDANGQLSQRQLELKSDFDRHSRNKRRGRTILLLIGLLILGGITFGFYFIYG